MSSPQRKCALRSRGTVGGPTRRTVGPLFYIFRDIIRGVTAHTYIPQGPVQTAEDEIVHGPGFAEAHFMLSRMHIHINRTLGHIQIQYKYRMSAMEHYVAVGLADGVPDQFIADSTAIDIEVLQICLAAVECRQTNPAFECDALLFPIDSDRLAGESVATQLRDE